VLTTRVTGLPDVAVRLAAKGLHVFPCRPGSKVPAVAHGSLDGSADAATVAAWWARWPAAPIGVATSLSGLVVVDLDGPDAEAAWAALLGRHGQVQTLTSRTGREGGGRHLWFRDGGNTVPNSAGRVGPHIDVRGRNGYVIAPPSPHPSGRHYAWDELVTLAALPTWLRALADPPAAGVAPLDPTLLHAPSAYGWRALCTEVQRIVDAFEGTRNDTLARGAFRMGQLVATGALTRTDAIEGMTAAGEAAGLAPSEVLSTVGRCVDAGAHRPRVAA